jgi:hypothetical protein
VPAWPCRFWRNGRVPKNDTKGFCAVVNSEGQGGKAALFRSISAGPCHNFQSANDLNERSKLAEGQNTLSCIAALAVSAKP